MQETDVKGYGPKGATGCAAEFPFFAVSMRQQVFRSMKKPAELAGFSVK
jgi:hypothetical protein